MQLVVRGCEGIGLHFGNDIEDHFEDNVDCGLMFYGGGNSIAGCNPTAILPLIYCIDRVEI
jgi:hypothetical protein